MTCEYTTKDYNILKAVIDRDGKKKGFCKGYGTTIKEIIKKTKLSDKKVRITLAKFEEEGFIEKTIKVTNANAYIITKKGMDELNSLRKNILSEVCK